MNCDIILNLSKVTKSRALFVCLVGYFISFCCLACFELFFLKLKLANGRYSLFEDVRVFTGI